MYNLLKQNLIIFLKNTFFWLTSKERVRVLCTEVYFHSSISKAEPHAQVSGTSDYLSATPQHRSQSFLRSSSTENYNTSHSSTRKREAFCIGVVRHFFTRLIFFSLAIFLSACAPTIYTQNSGLGSPQKSSSFFSYAAIQADQNLWQVLGSSCNLPDETPENFEVRKQINWYMSNPAYLQQVAEQARPYLYYIFQQVKRRHLPAELALLPMVESNYDPFANSTVGAAGLWQMMPGTASGFGLKIDWWYDGRRDIIASTNAALDYLVYLCEFFNQSWLLAIAAYDTGEGTVNQAIQHNAKLGKPTDFWNLPLPQETKSYVPKLLALATIIKNPNDYPIALPYIQNAPYLAAVNINSQIDLAHAAKMAEMSLEELSKLNPGYSRWATDPNIPTRLVLPVDKAAVFEQALEKLPSYQRVTWIRYTIKQGDSLIGIANKHKISPDIIKQVNHLKSNTLQPEQVLLIPLSLSKLTQFVLKSEQQYFKSLHHIPTLHITNYTVQKGDTLETIAKKYNIKSHQICFWNGLKSNQELKPGLNLILWPPHYHYIYHYKNIVYRVRAGDSLDKIARRHNIKTQALRQYNHLKSILLKPGEKINIPIVEKETKIDHAVFYADSQEPKIQHTTPKKTLMKSHVRRYYALNRRPLPHHNMRMQTKKKASIASQKYHSKTPTPKHHKNYSQKSSLIH